MLLIITHYLHILFGVIWAGSTIALTFVVLPSLIADGGDRGARFGTLLKRAGPIMGASGGLLMLTGLVRAWAGGGVASFGDILAPYGLLVLLALILVIAAEGHGGPTRKKLETLLAQGDGTAEEAKALVRRDAWVHLVVILLVLGIMVMLGLGLY